MVKPTKAEQAILESIGEPSTPLEIAQVLGKKKSAVWMLMNIMVRKGLLVKVDEFGRYWFAHPEIHGAEE